MDKQFSSEAFESLRSQITEVCDDFSDDQILTLAEDLHDKLRHRRRAVGRSRGTEDPWFGDVLFERRV